MSIVSLVKRQVNKLINTILNSIDRMIKASVIGILFTIVISGASKFFADQIADKLNEFVKGLRI